MNTVDGRTLEALSPAEAAECFGGEDHSWLYYLGYAIGWSRCHMAIPSTAYADAKVGYH